MYIFDPDKVWDDILMEFGRFLTLKRVQKGSQMVPQIDAKMGAKSGPGETMKTVLPSRQELTLALQAGV